MPPILVPRHSRVPETTETKEEPKEPTRISEEFHTPDNKTIPEDEKSTHYFIALAKLFL